MKHNMRTNLERYEGTCVAFGHYEDCVRIQERMRVHEVHVRYTHRACELCVWCVCVWWIVVWL